MSKKIQPLADRVVVQVEKESEKKTASGIILPDTMSKEKPMMGSVIAVGPGRVDDGQRVAPEVKVGDTIIFSKYSPTEVKIDEQDYLILSESDILAIVA